MLLVLTVLQVPKAHKVLKGLQGPRVQLGLPDLLVQPVQPVLTVLSSSQNKVRVQLDATARAVFKADVEATTDDHIPAPPFLEYPDFDGSFSTVSGKHQTPRFGARSARTI